MWDSSLKFQLKTNIFHTVHCSQVCQDFLGGNPQLYCGEVRYHSGLTPTPYHPPAAGGEAHYCVVGKFALLIAASLPPQPSSCSRGGTTGNGQHRCGDKRLAKRTRTRTTQNYNHHHNQYGGFEDVTMAVICLNLSTK